MTVIPRLLRIPRILTAKKATYLSTFPPWVVKILVDSLTGDFLLELTETVLFLLIVDLMALRELSFLAKEFGSRLDIFPTSTRSKHSAVRGSDTG